jgi:hypothetical protein
MKIQRYLFHLFSKGKRCELVHQIGFVRWETLTDELMLDGDGDGTGQDGACRQMLKHMVIVPLLCHFWGDDMRDLNLWPEVHPQSERCYSWHFLTITKLVPRVKKGHVLDPVRKQCLDHWFFEIPKACWSIPRSFETQWGCWSIASSAPWSSATAAGGRSPTAAFSLADRGWKTSETTQNGWFSWSNCEFTRG